MSVVWTEWRSAPLLEGRLTRVSPYSAAVRVTVYNRAPRPLHVTGVRVRPRLVAGPARKVELQPHTLPDRDRVTLDLRIGPLLPGAADWPSTVLDIVVTVDTPLLGSVDVEVLMPWRWLWQRRSGMTIRLRAA